MYETLPGIIVYLQLLIYCSRSGTVPEVELFSAYGPGLKKQMFWDMYNMFRKQESITSWAEKEF